MSEEFCDDGLFKQVAESFGGTLEGEGLVETIEIIISYSGFYCPMFSILEYLT